LLGTAHRDCGQEQGNKVPVDIPANASPEKCGEVLYIGGGMLVIEKSRCDRESKDVILTEHHGCQTRCPGRNTQEKNV